MSDSTENVFISIRYRGKERQGTTMNVGEKQLDPHGDGVALADLMLRELLKDIKKANK